MQTQPLEELTKIQAKGVLTIPKKLRIKTGITDNSIVRMKEEKGKIIIEPVRTLPYPVRSYTDKEVQEFFALDEGETKELKKKKLL